MKKSIGIIVLVLVAGFGFANGTEEEQAASGPLVLDAFVAQGPAVISVEDNQWTDYVEEKFDVDLQFIVTPVASREEKINLLMASGDYPSVLFHANFDPSEQIRYGSQGAIIPLNELIEEHGPTIMARLREHPDIKRDVTSPDGNIYGLPTVEGCYHCTFPHKIWINTEWLENVGLEMPQTTAEFKAVLEAFKTEDPNRNGLADEIPLSGAIQSWYCEVWPFLMNAFVPISFEWENAEYVDVQDDKVYFAAATEEWRDGLAYMNELHEAGLLDQQALTQKLDQLRALGNNPDEIILGAYSGGHLGMAIDLSLQDRYIQYRAVPPLEGPDGAQYAGYLPPVFNLINFAITSKATPEQQLKALEIADWTWTVEGTLTSHFGPQGVGWRWAEDGEFGLDGEPGIYTTLFDKTESMHNRSIEDIGGFWYFDLFNSWTSSQDITEPDGYERFLVLETDKYEPHAPEQIVPPSLYYGEEDARQVAQYRTELQNYVDQATVAFITGQRNLDSGWDSYVEGLSGLGLEDYLSLVQEAYDAQR